MATGCGYARVPTRSLRWVASAPTLTLRVSQDRSRIVRNDACPLKNGEEKGETPQGVPP